ncbi:MAG: response regulator transcription factor [Actinomycetales bacterium]|nr:response regulator transcription factor [Actinomycetales bacterium]
MIRVLVADDQVLLRRAFAALLDSDEGVQVVAEAGTGREAVERSRATLPDVVLMDIRMPIMDGIAATREICADPVLRGTRVLVLTTFDLDEYVYEALRAGASGFLLKDVEPVELLRAVRVVAAGDALLAPRVTRRLILEFAARPGTSAPSSGVVDRLTEREREIVRLVAYGLSNLEIAGQLVISPLTVKTHVSRVLSKLGCRDRAQLVGLAYEHHLVRPGDRRQDG